MLIRNGRRLRGTEDDFRSHKCRGSSDIPQIEAVDADVVIITDHDIAGLGGKQEVTLGDVAVAVSRDMQFPKALRELPPGLDHDAEAGMRNFTELVITQADVFGAVDQGHQIAE